MAIVSVKTPVADLQHFILIIKLVLTETEH